ncbi:MAG: hypothetical protein MZV63_72235 [Marinilabiliales bacterium]|nr:hypothetical protein [Marinilabiliales bacterium]
MKVALADLMAASVRSLKGAVNLRKVTSQTRSDYSDEKGTENQHLECSLVGSQEIVHGENYF